MKRVGPGTRVDLSEYGGPLYLWEPDPFPPSHDSWPDHALTEPRAKGIFLNQTVACERYSSKTVSVTRIVVSGFALDPH